MSIARNWRLRLSLRNLAIVPIAIQTIGAVSLVTFFSWQNSRSAVEEMAHRLANEITNRVSEQLEAHLQQSQEINRLNADAVRLGILDPNDSEALLQLFHAQMLHYRSLSLISFISTENELFEISRFTSGKLQADLVLAEHPRTIRSYALDAAGQRSKLIATIPNFNPQQTPPGYRNAIAANSSTWNPVHAYAGVPEMSLSASIPARQADGKLAGVFFADFALSNLDRYLQSLDVGSGRIFITDAAGLLVATSGEGGSLDTTGPKPRRLLATDSSDPLLVAAGHHKQDRHGTDPAAANHAHHHYFKIDTACYHLHVKPFRDEFGLDWTIHVLVPDADFLTQIQAGNRTTVLLCVLTLVVALSLGGWTARWLIRRVDRLNQTTQQLATEVGEADIGWRFEREIPSLGVRELDTLAGAIARMAGKVQDVLARLQHKAFYDPLVGLPNQNLLLDRIHAARERHRQQKDFRFAVLAVDIKRFRALRFGLGWEFGDDLVVAFARRLAACAGEGNTLARVGDGEFILLLEDLRDHDAAQQAARRLHNCFAQPLVLPKTQLPVTIAVGIAQDLSPEASSKAYLRAAHTALDYAQRESGASTTEFSPAMQAVATESAELEAELKAAIANGDIAIHYQPIFELHTGRVKGFEALARWHHPIRGPISPGRFIPLAEETGSILELGSQVLQQASQQFSKWQQELPGWEHVHLNVNFSWLQLRQPNLLEDLDAAQALLPPGTLRLEMTESSLLVETAAALDFLHMLRDRQVSVAVDDFGTGYSSLSYLQNLPVDALKVDRAFIRCLATGSRDRSIVNTILTLAQTLKLDVVVEGIETQEQLDILRSLGCSGGQGYLFSRPLPAADVPAYWREYCRSFQTVTARDSLGFTGS